MDKNLTIFQKLTKFLSGENTSKIVNTQPDIVQPEVLFTAETEEEFNRKALQAKQQHLLARQWKKAKYDINNKSLSGLSNIQMMYRDADLMDAFPEIGTALDIVSEEACFIPTSGMMLNITSKSERIKSILQDLFVNRLSINTILPMICRATCKYGNQYMLLNIDMNNGVTGWKQLPVYDMQRFENGMENPYAQAYTNLNTIDVDKEDSTKFVWIGQNDFIPYRNWQIAHFRLLYDNIFLPYGCSMLNKARRHFRMLSMMEDMMLIYRLERSIERRVFKINVGAIDEADVPSYVQQIADNFKRTPIVDPLTGQLDLKKNILGQSEDFFIPVREDNAASPIETLPAAQNLTAMDDIKFIENKVLTALRIPKSFLNFEEEKGDGKNLSLLDVRFTRTVNRIQQAMLMELNKIAIIHLYLLGFTDDLTNFSLTMNNPSSQAEMLELDNLAKKVSTAKDAMTDGGSGIPLMSFTRACKLIMKWSDKEIEENLEELRLERALAAELENTPQIIKRTGKFDTVDNLYGEPGATYADNNANGGEEQGEGPMGGGSFGGGFGGADLDFGDADTDMDMGEEGEMGMDMAAEENGGNEAPMNNEPIGEAILRKKTKQINAQKQIIRENLMARSKHYQDLLMKHLSERNRDTVSESLQKTELYNKTFLINEELDNISHNLNTLVNSTNT